MGCRWKKPAKARTLTRETQTSRPIPPATWYCYPNQSVKKLGLILEAIELLELKSKELSNLAQRTRIMINAIGPYSVHGSLVMEACATNGTNYLDL